MVTKLGCDFIWLLKYIEVSIDGAHTIVSI